MESRLPVTTSGIHGPNRLTVAACVVLCPVTFGLGARLKGMTIAQRYRSLLKLNDVVRNEDTLEGVFQGLCSVLRDAVPYDRASLSIYDPDHDGLKIIGLYGPHPKSIFCVGHVLRREETQAGWVFENKDTMFRRDVEKEPMFPGDEYILNEGYHSLCSIPLIAWESTVGVISVVASRASQMSRRHAEVVRDVSDQITLAVTSLMPRCRIHGGTKLMCPKCIGAAGGKKTVLKHREDLSSWGKTGGRGRKKPNSFQPSVMLPDLH